MPSCSYATIAPCKEKTVPVAVWDIKTADEKRLDCYEGYPFHYFKRDIPVKMDNGEELSAMVYIMDLNQKFGLPSGSYYDTVLQGYRDCGLDVEVFKNAVNNSADTVHIAWLIILTTTALELITTVNFNALP